VGIFKSVMGFGGVERVGERIVGELEAARDRGEAELEVGYSQSEIGVRANATQMGAFIRRKIEKAGFAVTAGEGGEYGADVRMLVRWAPVATAVPGLVEDPDLAQFHRSVQAAEDGPPVGDEGAGLPPRRPDPNPTVDDRTVQRRRLRGGLESSTGPRSRAIGRGR
jgi:hypothetical protein